MKAQQPKELNLPTHATQRSALDFQRSDDPNWHWLEAHDTPQVKDFLNTANQSFDQWFKPLKGLAENLYQSQLARRELAAKGLPTAHDHFTLWSEISAEADHPVWWRHPNDSPDHSECFFDIQARASEHVFFDIGDMALSPDENWLAWSEDTQGNETYTVWLKHLPDGAPKQLLSDVGPELCWAEDNRTLIFTRFDTTQRPDSLWRLPLELEPHSTRIGEATLMLHEDDGEFWVSLGKTRSRQWLLLECASKDTSETWLVPASLPETPPHCFLPRETGVEYGIDHRAGHFYLLHNRDARHFCLDRIDESTATQSHNTANGTSTERLIAHRQNTTLESIDAFSWGLAISERDHAQAQTRIRIIDYDTHHQVQHDRYLLLPETPCSQVAGDNPHFNSRHFRLAEESFTQPPSWFEINLDNGQRRLLRRLPVLGDLQPEQLTSRRLWVRSHDGERIPVSVVSRSDLSDQPLPTLLYGYGAYGDELDPWFSIARLELLNRGVAFAVAHVRGGGECGEPWYQSGKLEHKANSFHDFIAARNGLVDAGVSCAERVVAYGSSAGGLLVAASLNIDASGFCGAVLDVPFVDVLRTMQNPDLPLTTAEYSEWGNPDDPDVCQRIRSYSPLDNLPPYQPHPQRPWPPVLIEGSWHDTRVAYWEPAKLYARLCQLEHSPSAAHPILLRTDMDTGHSGASGRFQAWRDTARQDAFILWALGCTERQKHAEQKTPRSAPAP
ncbi:S9 family peptidase [Halomonas halocynthiae]|uniref:S9 family peptidase n=1 Tax=Halomonas halocynthiae TaxID=176290 RepID=UPI000416C52A|nr:prolyl oligopeptidase family serine peptidase [Halomonas halocynthiae]